MKMTSSYFFCINCGYSYELPRKASMKRPKFHRKKLYCPHCKEIVNHIECKTQEELEECKQNFALGEYQDECSKTLAYCGSAGIG